jgi:transposase
MALYVRALSQEQRQRLEVLARSGLDQDVARRAQIVLLSSTRRGVQDISGEVGLHPINVRKWIHRFNQRGVEGLYPRRSPGRPPLFSEKQREAIVRMATAEPNGMGLDFAEWSLQRLRSQLIERDVVPEISAETIRQELLRAGLVYEGRRWVNTGV